MVVPRLEIAGTFLTRLRGLQFRRQMASDEGLLLAPCRSVHTHWMRFAIDIAMLGRDGVVIEVRTGVRPWRAVRGRREVFAILETAADTIAVSRGDQLHVAGASESTLPRSVRPLLRPADSA